MKVGGRDFDFTKEQIESILRGVEPEQVQKHAVDVNGELFPPKQVLAHVTGWERTTFTTMEAQRVLARVGFVRVQVGPQLLRQAGEFVRDAVAEGGRQVVREREDVAYLKGFSTGIGIPMRLIQTQMDDLRAQMKGTGLGRSEQAIYAHLDELRSAIETDGDRYWRGSGAEWRPLKPITKGAVREVGGVDE